MGRFCLEVEQKLCPLLVLRDRSWGSYLFAYLGLAVKFSSCSANVMISELSENRERHKLYTNINIKIHINGKVVS